MKKEIIDSMALCGLILFVIAGLCLVVPYETFKIALLLTTIIFTYTYFFLWVYKTFHKNRKI